MKKIEAIVLPSKEKDIVDALQKTGIGGLTITTGKGRGKGPRLVKPGVGRYIERYNDVLTFVIVVDDSKVDEIVSVITDVSHTGSLGDGKIFISTIDEIVDITTKQKGEKYI
ncbi:MAG: P-II family nitrogen regulator [Nitrosopumilus sp.]|nr:P-II family nitrogen regulator [Nitrosopumilus sp.]MDH3832654.1 P-II family nitrogen regulator [Nitrosopumilus sp.]